MVQLRIGHHEISGRHNHRNSKADTKPQPPDDVAELAAKAQEAQQKKEAQQTPPAGAGAPAGNTATAAQKKPAAPAPATP